MKNNIYHYIKFLLAFFTLMIILTACGDPPTYKENQKLGKQVNYTITGIEAGAGSMEKTEDALNKYGLKKANWQIMPTSTAAMTSTLDKAVKHKQPIVVLSWQPHWMVAKYSLKFLKDPKHVYGHGESMRTIARLGFRKENPGAAKLLKQFNWKLDMAVPLMLKINDGMDTQKAINEFIETHPKQVKKWTKGVPAGKGKKVNLVYTPYDYEIAATRLVKTLLKQKGYNVTMRQLDIGVMWSSIAHGSSDATVTVELPVTNQLYAKKYQGKYDELAKNMQHAKTGLAVPKYMKDINTIDDLKNK
ncbi:glycine betaine ABC transporter substrate-binding protein [Ligilactobacillus acidipiscis]|uniref:glycine betaine ABC transporter substrate-binding protein n=1 Tax=Ligilactobacillus acidipiscis TaxID=89059 RepID=UPI0009EC6089|nr:glycine betaine ABC transporter substrate-binding protein [Ligilactobacillus acidipiscis]GAW64856.1 glycine betaine/carnitine/choline ABC transporter substrate-binding protein [Ligilactobacillus acidipiscis]GEN21851.1 glycine/betaine ABC transporter substrate-binding protein [Ligilactobacillus acidipiscis]